MADMGGRGRVGFIHKLRCLCHIGSGCRRRPQPCKLMSWPMGATALPPPLSIDLFFLGFFPIGYLGIGSHLSTPSHNNDGIYYSICR